MGDLEDVIPPMFKGAFIDLLKSEELLAGAAQSLIEDEIKRYIRQKLDENHELKREIKKAMEGYMEARVRQLAAQVKLMGLTAKLGILLIPEDVRAELSGEILSIFEKELGKVLEKTL